GAQPLILLAALSALVLFARLTREMMEGETGKFDTAILVWLRQPSNLGIPKGPPWLLQSAIDISALGGFTVLWMTSLAVVGWLLIERRRADALLLALSIGGAALANGLLKPLVDRGRPEVTPHLVQVVGQSYPSGHAMISAAAYLTLAAIAVRGRPPQARIYL